jgi:hypothetical protein
MFYRELLVRMEVLAVWLLGMDRLVSSLEFQFINSSVNPNPKFANGSSLEG